MTGQYKIISDNLGEYSVVSKDNVIVATEIQHRITAETFCEELNILAEENEQLKQSNKDAWNLIRFIYNEIKEDGYIDWERIQDLVEF